MQDNKYIDRGWQQMAMLLDRELPQENRRNRKALWWFVAAGIALVLSGWAYHFWQTPQDNLNEGHPHPTEERMSETASVIPTQSEDGLSSASNGATTTETAKTSSSVAIESPMMQKETKQAIPSQVNTHGRQLESVSSRGEVALMELKQSSTFLTTITETEQQTEEIISIPQSKEVVVSNAADNVEPITAMQSEANAVRTYLSLARLDSKTQALDYASPVQSIEPGRVKRMRTVGLDGLVSAHMNAEGNPLYGVEAGLTTVFRPNRKVRMRAGVTYGYYNADGLGILDFNSDAETLNNGNGGPEPSTGAYDIKDVYSNSLEFADVEQLTEKFHYLHVPISAEYRISSSLSVMAGMKLSALLSAPARYRLNDEVFAASGEPSRSKNFLYNYGILEKFDIAPVFALSYRITKDLWLDASYTHGLRHYINNSESGNRSDFHRTGGLGIRYQIL